MESLVTCQKCETANPIDSRFCKQCGAELSEEVREAARVRVSELVDEGNQLFTEGRIDEALLVGQTAVKSDPSNPMAYALIGLCYEKMGHLAESLEAYETASSLNPGSALDRIKVQSLRQRLTQATAVAEPAPDRRRALTVAAAAVILVAGFGSLLAFAFNPKPTKVALKDSTQQADVSGFSGTDSSANNPGQQVQQQNNSGNGTTAPTNTDSSSSGKSIRLPSINGNDAILPDPGNNPIEPISITKDPGQGGNERNPPVTNNGKGGGGIDPEPGKESDGQESQPTNPPAEDHGVIDIKLEPAGGGRPTQPGAQPISGGLGGNGLDALRHTAQSQFETGKYGEAAKSLERLAKSGGNSARTQQRLGQCYENIGNTTAALKAYNAAVSMYQTEIKAGRNVEANQRGLNTCLQALKVVGGG